MKLVAVRWSRGNRPVLEYRHPSGSTVRYPVPVRGCVTMLEAQRALGLGSTVRLYRMKARGALRTRRIRGATMIGALELARVRRVLQAQAA